MRFLVGVVLAVGFFLTGLIILGAGFEITGKEGMSEDAMAAFFMGGMLSAIGIAIFFAARGARKRMKAGKKPDYSNAGATILGMTMVSDAFDGEAGGASGD